MEGLRISPLPVETVRDRIAELVDVIKHPELRRICSWALNSNSGFYSAYGAAVDTAHHHAYEGGLAVHTLEVMSIANYYAGMPYLGRVYQGTPDNDFSECVDRDVVLTAALFHDYGKIDDYDENGKKTDYRNKIRHVSGSHAFFLRWAHASGIPLGTTRAIEHCILAHHGRPEWGSPVEPQTVEAHILHYADNLSARYGVYR